jgi:NAD/NADP transhydrogenase alpha subunit
VALVPSVVDKLTKLGPKLQLQSGAADAAKLTDATFKTSRSLTIATSCSATPIWLPEFRANRAVLNLTFCLQK